MNSVLLVFIIIYRSVYRVASVRTTHNTPPPFYSSYYSLHPPWNTPPTEGNQSNVGEQDVKGQSCMFCKSLICCCPSLSSQSSSYLPVFVSMMRALAQHLNEDSTAPQATASEGSRVRRVVRRSTSNSCLKGGCRSLPSNLSARVGPGNEGYTQSHHHEACLAPERHGKRLSSPGPVHLRSCGCND